jgi:hypothetical protein
MSEARSKLREAVRGVWADPAFETIRTSLESQAQSSGFAACLEDKMAKGTAGKASYEKCAKDANLKAAYKAAWGKPAVVSKK